MSQDVRDDEWKKLVNALMRANCLEYHLLVNKTGIEEVYRLKENYANR